MLSAFLFLAAAPAALPAGQPDVAVNARVHAREVTVKQQGRASARVTVEPSAGERIAVERNLPKRRDRYRNLSIDLAVEARLADPSVHASASASSSDQQGQTQGTRQ